ncbi:MAG TPA: DegT/DnrJ/EryC1/StrS family aminotransferase [Bacteroidales bacterium]|nr:DegT/DnrJ/EryC1/StrS family aminotransferase [Bacteroidales bacterium]
MLTIKYPLATETWDHAEYTAINNVIASGKFTMGDKVKEFENNFSKFFNIKYSVMVNSGSSANLLAIAALFYRKHNNLKAGDEIIVPAVSWSTSYFPLYQYGLKLKFVDIDIETLNYDIDSLKNAVSSNTKAILVVNLLGNPNDFDKINKIISKQDIIIIEDNCESMGAEYNKQKTGTFGTVGTFSTFFSHHISTMEGGVVVTNDKEIYHILLSLRSHGWTRHLPKENLITGTKLDNAFEESFKFVLPGYNVRPGELNGAIGVEQLKKLPAFVEKRRENAKIFVSLFKDNPNFYIQKEIEQSSWFGFSLVIKPNSKLKRNKIIELLEKNNIEVRPIVAGNFTKNPVMKYFDKVIHNKLSNADYISKNGFFVGNHHYDLTINIQNLANLLNNY